MWWIILCVNLMGLRDVQIVGCVYEGISGRVSIWISRLRKEYYLHQCMRASSNPLRACLEQKVRGRSNSLSAWAETSIFSCPWSWVLLVLWPSHSDQLCIISLWTWTELHHLFFWFSRWQVVGLLGPHNYMNQLLIINLLIYIHICLWFILIMPQTIEFHLIFILINVHFIEAKKNRISYLHLKNIVNIGVSLPSPWTTVNGTL